MKFADIDLVSINGTEFRIVREYDDIDYKPLVSFDAMYKLDVDSISNLKYENNGDIRVLSFDCKNKYVDIWSMGNDSVKISDIGYDEHVKIGIEPRWFITISRVFEHTLLWYGSTAIHTQRKNTANIAFINNIALINKMK